MSVTEICSHREELLADATRAAREAGRLLRERFAGDAGLKSAAGRDLKTLADTEAEKLIRSVLEPSGRQILGEETPAGSDFDRQQPFWCVDPLDGTINFTRGFPACCVSVAYCEEMRPVVGVIYDFQAEVLYQGVVGKGAWANEQPLTISPVDDPAQGVLATGFPTGRSYSEDALKNFVGRVQNFKKIRMIGSAALSLAHVSAGHFDAYFEESIWWWDVAAGLALVEAAGGRWSAGPVGADWKADVRAWNGCLPEYF